MFEIPNRGKRSVGLDVSTDDGRELLYRLVETADVFVTNYLPDVRKRLGIDVDDIRAATRTSSTCAASGQGARGPEAERGGFDGASFWARAGSGHGVQGARGRVAGRPTSRVRRRHGWADDRRRHRRRAAAPRAHRYAVGRRRVAARPRAVEPRTGGHRRRSSTRASRSRPSTATRSRTRSSARTRRRTAGSSSSSCSRPTASGPTCARTSSVPTCSTTRASRTARRATSTGASASRCCATSSARAPTTSGASASRPSKGVWAPLQTPLEVHDDPQVVANGYLEPITASSGAEFVLPANPVQFDETPPSVRGMHPSTASTPTRCCSSSGSPTTRSSSTR